MVAAESYPISFSSATAEPSSLTWMVIQSDISPEAIERFQNLLLFEGRVDADVVANVVPNFFGLLGSVFEAKCIKLTESCNALAFIEKIPGDESGTEPRMAYHMLIPLLRGFQQPPAIQRLCFYSSVDQFKRCLPMVQSISESFHYKEPFKPHFAVPPETPHLRFD